LVGLDNQVILLLSLLLLNQYIYVYFFSSLPLFFFLSRLIYLIYEKEKRAGVSAYDL